MVLLTYHQQPASISVLVAAMRTSGIPFADEDILAYDLDIGVLFAPYPDPLGYGEKHGLPASQPPAEAKTAGAYLDEQTRGIGFGIRWQESNLKCPKSGDVKHSEQGAG